MFITRLPIGKFHWCRYVFAQVILDIYRGNSWDMSWKHEPCDFKSGLPRSFADGNDYRFFLFLPYVLNTQKTYVQIFSGIDRNCESHHYMYIRDGQGLHGDWSGIGFWLGPHWQTKRNRRDICMLYTLGCLAMIDT